MAYKSKLEGILDHGRAARNFERRGRQLKRLLLRWRPLLPALLVWVAAPLLIAFRLGEPGSDTLEWPIADFPEPSGIVYHPARHTLFIVGDEGDIGEVSLEGKLLRKFRLGGDLEAVTIDPKSGLLYVAREGHEILFEVRPDDFRVLRRFTIDRSWQGDPNFLRRGGDGIEGLTFVPDENDPEGGRLWVVNQYDPAVLVQLSIALKSSKQKYQTARISKVVPVDSAPLSEVTWDAASREFLVVSALWKRVSVLDAGANYERSVRIPGFMPEGLARLDDGRFVIAQDSGGLVVWRPDSDPFTGQANTQPPAPGPSPGSAGVLPAKAPVGVALPAAGASEAGRQR